MSGNTNQFEWAKNIPCRNIQIHGFCKWENKGCSFNHDTVKHNSDNSASISTPATTTNKIDDINISNTGSGITTTQSAPIAEPSSFLSAEPNLASNPDLLVTPQEQKAKFNFDIPSFTPTSSLTSKFAALSPSLNEIPSFIPSSASINTGNNNNTINSTTTTATTNVNASNTNIPIPESKSQNSTVQESSLLFPNSNTFNPETAPVFTPSATIPTLPSSSGIDHSIVSPNINSHILDSNYINSQPELIRSTEEQLFYQNTNLFPMNYHLYAPQPPPHIEMNKKKNERTVNDLFIDSKFREYLQQKNESSLRSISNNQLDIPLHVNEYHSLYPIDHNFENSEKSYGYNSFIYKCLSNIDGKLYCMRRLQDVPITSAEMLKSVKKWKLIDCANVVKIYQVFTTRAFGDNSLILIYDYFPMSYNLLENHFLPPGNKNPELITEDSLWSYTIQLLNAITEVKKNGLSIGPMDPSKIILTNKGRIRISSVAIRDIVKEVENKNHHNSNNNNSNNNNNNNNNNDDDDSDDNFVNNVDKENDENDLLNLGGLIFLLAKSTTFIRSTGNEQFNPLEIIPQLNFTSVFKKMLSYLFQSDSTIEKFQELVAPQILKVTNGLQNSCDFMEANLMKELENARLVRLFSKLDFISERPEFVKDGSWSETGERYPIKLFKDYVFHQVDGRGEPVIDLTHAINCLNKLDAGVDENLLLVSPDEMTCLIMSYNNLKELVESSFQKLLGRN